MLSNYDITVKENYAELIKSINLMGIGNYPINTKNTKWVLKHHAWIKMNVSTPQGYDKLRIKKQNSFKKINSDKNISKTLDNEDEIIEENDKLYNDIKSIHHIKASVPYLKDNSNSNFINYSNLHLYIIGDKLVGKKSLKKFIENVNEMITKRLKNINKVIELIITIHNNDDIPADILIKDDTSKWILFMYDVTNNKSLETIVKIHDDLNLNNWSNIKNDNSENKSNYKTFCIGNKIDFEFWRKIDKNLKIKKNEAFLNNIDDFYEISILSGQNIHNISDKILSYLYSDTMDELLLFNPQEEILLIDKNYKLLQNTKLSFDDMMPETESYERFDESLFDFKISRSNSLDLNCSFDDDSIYSSEVHGGGGGQTRQVKGERPTSFSSHLQPNLSPSGPSPQIVYGRRSLTGSPVDNILLGAPSTISSLHSLSSLPPPGLPPCPPFPSHNHPSFLTPSTTSPSISMPSSKSLSSSLILPIELTIENEKSLPVINMEKKNITRRKSYKLEEPIFVKEEARRNKKEELFIDKSSSQLQPQEESTFFDSYSSELKENINNDDDDSDEDDFDSKYENSVTLLDNIDNLLERGDCIEDLKDKSDSLSQKVVVTFNKKKKKKCLICFKNIRDGIVAFIDLFSGGKNLFDNVLADTENAFQTLAKLLVFLMGVEDTIITLSFNLCSIVSFMYNFITEYLFWFISFIIINISSVLLILPSFFTLLIVRTTTVEKESENFGIRQEAVRVEKIEQSTVRWIRIILRSLPMTFYLIVLPYILVYKIFPNSTKLKVVSLLFAYIIGILILQCLGTIRAYYSWIDTDKGKTIPEAPLLFEEKEIKVSFLSNVCFKKSNAQQDEEKVNNKILIPTDIPPSPNRFLLSSPDNILVLLSLLLEFFQMATFPLQNSPYSQESTIETDDVSTSSDSMGNSSIEEFSSFVYIKWFVGNLTIISMWTTIGIVGLLIFIFSNQFLMELRKYGGLMKDVKDKHLAKDSFFFSFTGSIVYGHGNPNNVGEKMRTVVGIITDGLFLVISQQLLDILSCNYDESNSSPTLYVNSSTICWQGNHSIIATIALISYAFYIPLSIMIAPMLMESSPDNTGVSYTKVYLMFDNVLKSIMLLIGSLGPKTVQTVVISATFSSLILAVVTMRWFQMSDPHSYKHYSQELQPCNVAFVNLAKSASYTASVVSAIIVIIAHIMGSKHFRESSLLAVLIIAWSITVLFFAIYYYRWQLSYNSRYEMIDSIIKYPFELRDYKIKTKETGFDDIMSTMYTSDLINQINQTTGGVEFEFKDKASIYLDLNAKTIETSSKPNKLIEMTKFKSQNNMKESLTIAVIRNEFTNIYQNILLDANDETKYNKKNKKKYMCC